jgi:two-component system CheB/CheR fusion protein
LLLQILRNLVNNAVKFTSSGKVIIGCRRRGDRVAIEVWDSGPGILDAEMAKIFDFFQKGQTRPTGIDDGLGLGLAIVRHLSEILGHEIKVVSRAGKGSCFSVLVPIGNPASGDLVAMRGVAIRQTGPRNSEEGSVRILIVEDEPSVRESLELLLVDEGYVIATAPNGREALAVVSPGGFCPEIIIVDYSIPGGMNGLDVIDGVRVIVGQQVPAVILTGDMSSTVITKIANKANVHLIKPVQAEELLEAIQCLRARTPPMPASVPSASTVRGSKDPAPTDTVIVVDDDAAVREAICLLLESFGHSVVAYASGREFIEAKVANCRGCLILDACMPGVDGFEVLAHVVATDNNLPVIMITGQSDVQMAVRAMKTGAFEFIEKPVDPDQLRISVDHALRSMINSKENSLRRAAAAENVASLTKRQRAVMDLIVAGHVNKVIAFRLGITQRTVESHRATVMKKLGAKTFADLIRLALAAI